MPHPAILVEAEKLHAEGKFEESAKRYDHLLAQNERHPWILAGMAQSLMHKVETLGTAIALFHSSIEQFTAKKERIPTEVFGNLGLAYKASGQIEKAKTWLKRAVEHDPDSAAALCNYGCMFSETHAPQEGRSYLEKAVAIDPSIAMAHWNLSLSLLSTAHADDNWGRAWDEYEWGQKEGGPRIYQKHLTLPEWDGAKGRRVLTYGEQGLGDEIMFASMLPELRRDSEEVLLDCHPRLVRLFEKSFPDVKINGTRKDKDDAWVKAEKPDCMISLGSLGKFYRREKKAFTGMPYLKADPLPKGNKFRIGISWTGGRLTHRVAKRTIPLSWWNSILSNDCEFVSMQYTEDCEKEIEVTNAKLGTSIVQHPSAKAIDYYEAAQFVASCDLIITVTTSILHLAGALGVPCWVMVPFNPDWRSQVKGPMPWYRSVRLYRQPANEDGAWIPVVQKVGYDLSELLKERVGQRQLEAA